MIGAPQLAALAGLLDDPAAPSAVIKMADLYREWAATNVVPVPTAIAVLEMAALAAKQKLGAAESNEKRQELPPLGEDGHVARQAEPMKRTHYKRSEVCKMTGTKPRTLRDLIAKGKVACGPFGIPASELFGLAHPKEES
jgi:hypothetical protein